MLPRESLSRAKAALPIVVMVLLLSATASAQQDSGFAGAVIDESGLVLPGVTIEATSPALIEGTRTVITDGQGRYLIVDLRSGTYTLTFTLAGFRTEVRESIELPGAFTATIDVEMGVGNIEETVTVTGVSPVVDVVSSVPSQTLSQTDVEALPQVRSFQSYGTMIPAVKPSSGLGGRDVGGSAGEPPIMNSAHGSTPGQSSIDGIKIISMQSANWRWINSPSNMVQEAVVQVGSGDAEAWTGGPQINLISRAGGNVFSGNVSGEYTGEGWDADNLSDELIDMGITTRNTIGEIFDFGAGVGGPIVRDKLWFYGSYRKYGTKTFIAGNFFNKTPHTLFYEPDLDRQAFIARRNWASGGRVTWQAAQDHRITYQYNGSYQCFCPQGPEFGLAPSGSYIYELAPQWLQGGGWTWTPNSSLLVEARGTYRQDGSRNDNTDGVLRTDRTVFELSTGTIYGSNSYCSQCVQGNQTVPASQFHFTGSVSYITGSHNFKVGTNWHNGNRTWGATPNFPDYYLFFNRNPLLIGSNTAYRHTDNLDMALGLFAQDSWTLDRLTLNLGIRYDHISASTPAQTRPAGFYTPEIFFPEAKNLPNWKSIHPRIGAAYDLFGTGRTAIKGSIGRYEIADTYGLAFARVNSPVAGLSTGTTRFWVDVDQDFEPDCDLRNGSANGECGPWSNQAFGSVLPIRAAADDVAKGFNVSPTVWQGHVTFQQELARNVSVTAGYYRTWYNNLTVTDNRATTFADYDPYCITQPVDSRLPGGGGNEVCEFYDVSVERFGQVDDLLIRSGDVSQVYNGFDFLINARLDNGLLVFGGVNTGRTVEDNCGVPDAPAPFCEETTSWGGDTALKLSAVYPVPWQDITLSTTYQNSTGANRDTDYVATNAEIAPSLGRNLSSCPAPTGPCGASVTIPIVAPSTFFEPRTHQVDLRIAKSVTLPGAGGNVRVNFDLYNLFNSSAANNVQGRFGPIYLRPQTIFPGRLMKLGGLWTW